MKLYLANPALLCVFAVKFSFFNRKVRKGMRKERKEKRPISPCLLYNTQAHRSLIHILPNTGGEVFQVAVAFDEPVYLR